MARSRRSSVARSRVVAPVIAAAALATACSSGDPAGADRESAAPPNVLLITLDTTRADALGAYGQPRPVTPELDRLARAGVLFEQVYSASPSTLPSHATIMTGRMPFAHGVRANAGYQLAPDERTLAEVFAAHGYRTAAEVAAPVIGARTGLDQGFAHYRDLDAFDVVRKTVRIAQEEDGRTVPRTVELVERQADDVTRRGIELLREGEPFFLWLHYFDPHSFYVPPGAWARRFQDEPYYAEIHYTDHQVGRVLAELRALGLEERTLVVVTADHGEGLDEHGEASHSYFVYDTTMRVPWLLSWPGTLEGGGRIAATVRTADIAPTILELVGLPALRGGQGASLAGLVRGETRPPGLDAYGESIEAHTLFGSSALRFLRRGRWKYIHKLEPELYDLRRDPGEQRNRAAQEPERVAGLAAALRDWVLRDAEAPGDTRVPVDRETREQLRALGYVGAAPPSAFGDVEDLASLRGPDPREKLPDLALVSAGWAAIKADRGETAVALFEKALSRNPDSHPILLGLVEANERAGETARNEPLLRRAIEREPTRVLLYGFLGKSLLEQGRVTEAEEVLRAGLGVDLCDVPVRVMLAYLLSEQQRPAEQAAVLREGIASCEESANLRNDYAYLLATTPDPALRDGEAALRMARAVVREVQHARPDYLDTLACAHAAVGDFDRALALVDEAIALLGARDLPDDVTAPYRAHREAFAAGRAIGVSPRAGARAAAQGRSAGAQREGETGTATLQ